jgi:AbiU2
MTITGILIDMDVHMHNINAIHDWSDFKNLSSTSGRGMFFRCIQRNHLALLVIDLCKLLSQKKKRERQSFQVLIDKLKADPPKQCNVADLTLLQEELDAYHVTEAITIATLLTYRDKRFAHRDPDGPDDGTHLIPNIGRMVEHCQFFLVRIMTLAYKPKKPLERFGGHPTMFIDGLISDYRNHAHLLDKEATG